MVDGIPVTGPSIFTKRTLLITTIHLGSQHFPAIHVDVDCFSGIICGNSIAYKATMSQILSSWEATKFVFFFFNWVHQQTVEMNKHRQRLNQQRFFFADSNGDLTSKDLHFQDHLEKFQARHGENRDEGDKHGF